jgi:hypothetical protein
MTRHLARVAFAILLTASSAAPLLAVDTPTMLPDGSRRMESAASGYSLTFVRPVRDAEDSLWSGVELRKAGSPEPQLIRAADAPKSAGMLLAWSPYGDEGEPMDAWSPDGRFIAFREISCLWSPGDEYPVICHMHETAIVDLDHPDEECRGLLLGRYSFEGWVAGRPHTVRYSPTLTGDEVETELGACRGQ